MSQSTFKTTTTYNIVHTIFCLNLLWFTQISDVSSFTLNEDNQKSIVFFFSFWSHRDQCEHTHHDYCYSQIYICKQLLSHQYPTDLDNVIFHFQPKVEAVIHIHCSLKLNLLRRNTSIVFANIPFDMYVKHLFVLKLLFPYCEAL